MCYQTHILKTCSRKEFFIKSWKLSMCLGEENSQTCWGGRHNWMIKTMSTTMTFLSDLSWELHERRGVGGEYNHLEAYWMNQHFSGVRKQSCILWLRRWGNGSKKNMDKMSSQWSSFFPQAWTFPKFSITFQLSGVLSIASPRTHTSGGLTIWVGSGERLLIFLGVITVLWPQKETSILL